MAKGEWPLVIFTVTAQSAVGAFWWCCAALLAGGFAPEQSADLERLMVVIWIMIALAFGAATFHLGKPLRAINAAFRFGRSALSNEVVFGAAFGGMGFLTWLMSTYGLGSHAVQLGALALTAVFSVAFLVSMTTFYMMPTVPTWNTPLTPAAFIVTTIIGGSIVAAAIFASTSVTLPGFIRFGPLALACVGLVAAIAVTVLQSTLLPKINSSIKRATELSPHYAGFMAMRFVLLFSALGLWVFDLQSTGMLSAATAIACVVLVMIGEMIGRGVHFGVYMTVGLR